MGSGCAACGRRVDAREQLRSAHQLFSAMGGEASPNAPTGSCWPPARQSENGGVDTRDDLTPQEARIARLVGRRAANPEIAAELFLSPRTVEWHLRKVFMKLGISSRKELRTARRNVRTQARI